MSTKLPFARIQVVGSAGKVESRQPGMVAGVLHRLMAGLPVIPANAAEIRRDGEERIGEGVAPDCEEQSCVSYEARGTGDSVDDSADSGHRGGQQSDSVECREKKNANFLSSVSDGEEGEKVDPPPRIPSLPPSSSPLLPSLLAHLRAALSAVLWLCALWAAANMWSPCASVAWQMSVEDKYAPGGEVRGRGASLASLLAEHRSTRVL